MTSYVALGKPYAVDLEPLSAVLRNEGGVARRVATRATRRPQPPFDPGAFARLLSRSPVLNGRVSDVGRLALLQPIAQGTAARRAAAPARARPAWPGGSQTFVTETVIAEGLRQPDLAAARDFGARLVEEGLDGKALLKVDSVDRVFELVALLRAREVGSVTPNFLRRVVRPTPSAPATAWALARIGLPAAWQITKGKRDVSVAILDEGVDTRHPALRSAVVAERDFIGGNGASAMPDGDDAHGTACAGIAVSRDATCPGMAPRCSLVAARIAMDDGSGGWVFDDFATADAIDWAWRAGAAVLSNSWGGGAPSDAISRAFGRARTQGRSGKGAVVVIAAGNDQAPIDFPGNLSGYVTVGASNPKDERKTRRSSDGEYWWGSNYGPTLHLLAPGVFIWTADISGAAGYGPDDFTRTFNGTSAATPHVAGAAALMLSVNPKLSATTVRSMLRETARRLSGQTGWTRELGWGRLDVARAVALARDVARPSLPRAPGRKPVARARRLKR